MPVRTLVLDLDGTLIDSLPDLCAALNRLLRERGLEPFTPEAVKPMVGDGSHRLVERAFAARGARADEAAIATFLADYTAQATRTTRPYPEVPETLARLGEAGWRFAICTNKLEQAARQVLRALGLASFFAAIGAGDSFPYRKPDPRHLLATIAAAGGERALSVMTGDHANDVAAAKAAAIPSIFAAWGYGAPAMGEQATAIARQFADLAVIAPKLLA